MKINTTDGTLTLLVALLVSLIAVMVSSHEPMTLEQQQDYLEGKKNAECPHMPSEQHCRQEYNNIIEQLWINEFNECEKLTGTEEKQCVDKLYTIFN